MAKTLAEIIEQVKALNALSTSVNANEAAAAAAAANRLIDRYRLTQADLEVEEETPVIKDQDYIYQSGKVTVWKTRLIHLLTHHYGVAYFNDTSYANGRQVSRYLMVGRKSDMEIVRYMYTWLSLECERLSSLEEGSHQHGHRQDRCALRGISNGNVCHHSWLAKLTNGFP